VLQHGQHLRLLPKDIEIVQKMVKWLHQCYQVNPLSGESLTLLKLVVLWVVEHSQAVKLPSSVPISSSIGYAKLAPVIDLFRQHKAIDLTLTDAAKLCHISPSHFSRMFKSIFRCNFSQYSMQHKLYSAARLISQTDKSMTEISYELNFSSPSHFISQFKKQFSVTPKKYRSEIQYKG
jgi:AraC-like DNA-binding protein